MGMVHAEHRLVDVVRMHPQLVVARTQVELRE
jgi:hypothetical protein